MGKFILLPRPVTVNHVVMSPTVAAVPVYGSSMSTACPPFVNMPQVHPHTTRVDNLAHYMRWYSDDPFQDALYRPVTISMTEMISRFWSHHEIEQWVEDSPHVCLARPVEDNQSWEFFFPDPIGFSAFSQWYQGQNRSVRITIRHVSTRRFFVEQPIRDWLQTEVRGRHFARFGHNAGTVYIEDEAEAMHFILTWGSDTLLVARA